MLSMYAEMANVWEHLLPCIFVCSNCKQFQYFVLCVVQFLFLTMTNVETISVYPAIISYYQRHHAENQEYLIIWCY